MTQPRFVDVFASHSAWVGTKLQRFGVSEAEAPDVAQEVFVAVHAHLADYDPSRPMRPWLFGIAYRSATRWRALARHRHERSSELLGELRDAHLAADEALEQHETALLVRRAFATLTPPRRAILSMNVLDEQPMPKVAAQLGIPMNTAYSRLRLARRDLAKALCRVKPGEGIAQADEPVQAGRSRSSSARVAPQLP